ncbi:TlpA family protein disulfide reductase [Flavisolibacter sp. BT320]|nr:TlpA family protein disulfide reductase [Flavisolibacter longurius]
MRILAFVIFFWCTTICVHAQQVNFTIKGRINKASTAEKVFVQGAYVNAEIPIRPDKTFFFEGTLASGGDCWIYTDKSHPTLLWLGGGDLDMVLQETRPEGSDATSKAWLHYTSLSASAETETFKLLLERKDSVLYRFMEVPPTSLNDSLVKYYDVLLKDYILRHPQSAFSVRLTGLATTKKSARDLIALIDKKIAGEERQRIENAYRRDSLTQPGFTVADFRMKTLKGTWFSSKKLSSKYTLLEFWAHNCVPCRQQNPALVELYNRYKSKGFAIVGIGVESSKQAWQKATKEDKLPWIQISDLKGWDNILVKRYFLEAIPFNILMDENKKIIAADLHPESLKQKLQELLEN